MATSPVVLLDAVSAVGFGPIIDMGDSPIRHIGFRLEPSSDAQIDSAGGIGDAVTVQYSLDPTFPQPDEGKLSNAMTSRLTALPLEVDNPNGDPAPQSVIVLTQYDLPTVPLRQVSTYKYIRARLNVPLSQGTVTLKFFFETIM